MLCDCPMVVVGVPSRLANDGSVQSSLGSRLKERGIAFKQPAANPTLSAQKRTVIQPCDM